MNHGIHYASVCRTFVFVSHCILPDRCTADANAQMHDHCQSTCRLLYPMFFQYFFDWITLKFNYCWRPSCLDLATAQDFIPQLTPDSVSNTHQMPRAVNHLDVLVTLLCPWWIIIIHCLRQVCRFAYQHTRLMSRLSSLQPCCSHRECTHSSRVAVACV